MRRLISLCLLLIVGLLTALPTQANPLEQFAGCLTDANRDYAAHIIIKNVYDLKFHVYAMGIDDFDPQIEVRHEDGTLIGCNNDRDEMITVGTELPTASAGYNTKSAQMTVRFYHDEHPDDPPTDFHVYITNKNGRNGQFVFIYEGAWIEDGLDVDEFAIVPTEREVEAQTPLHLYVTNPDRLNSTLNPVITLGLGSDFSLTCEISSFAANCQSPNVVDLTGYTVTKDMNTTYTMTGADVMLEYTPDTAGREYPVQISALNQSSYGPYLFIVQYGVMYPPVIGPG